MNIGRETEQVEFKKSTSEIKEGVASVASILNKHGKGVLYFGVRNNGDICGQQVSDATLREISQSIGNRIKPSIYPQVTRETSDDGLEYIRVGFSGEDAPYSCDGRYRIRVADEDVLMSPEEIRTQSAKAEYRSRPWDTHFSGKTVADVDEGVLQDYVARGNSCGRIPFGYSGVQDTLSRLGVLEGGQLNNAAAVCFCPSDEAMLKVGIFADSNRVDILDVDQKKGTLFELAHFAELYILNNIRRKAIIDGSSMQREEVPEIPRNALREAIVNAFCHRDYTDSACVQVDIFWNAVEIFNPGCFPEGHAPDEYLAGEDTTSASRNKRIADILFRSKDIEAFGTGIQRIKRACEDAGVPFGYRQVKRGVYARFGRKDPYYGRGAFASGQDLLRAGANSPQVTPQVTPQVAALLATLAAGSLSTRDILAKLGLSDRKSFQEGTLSKAVEAGLVELTIPDKPRSSNQKYRLTVLGLSWLGKH